MPTDAPPPAAPVVARPAATVLLLRDGAQGLEVLLVRRAERAGDRHAGAYVFPGGLVDPADRQAHACCTGLADAQASARLGVAAHGLDFFAAAIRECFEEAGILIAEPPAALARHGAEALVGLRRALRAGELTLAAVCERLGVRLPVDRLAYHSHWITPVGLPKRFDTRFFVACLPAGQSAALDSEETADHCWLRPADALARADALRLPNPTRRTLAAISAHADAAACMAHTHALREIRVVQPVLAHGARGPRPVHPDEPAYAEIARIEQLGFGPARDAVEPGQAVRLSERVWRLAARNAGVMTGPGTNTYLVRDPASGRCAVIDPGPDDAAHVEAIVAAAPGPVECILVTHTHLDHSPAAAALRRRTGAPVMGRPAPDAPGHDEGFRPDRALEDGEAVALGGATTLRVLHTPGHASNHLCFLLAQEKTLFTGDHVMQGSTVVIGPPDGDMGAYLRSLARLLDEDLAWLAPGHGFLLAEPARAVSRLVAHRRAREAKVLEAVRAHGPATLEALLPRVYDDVPAHLHAPARRSLLAHLLLLRDEGQVRCEADAWRA